MHTVRKNYRTVLTVLFLSVLGVAFFATPIAHADWLGINSITGEAITSFFNQVFYLIFELAAKLLSFLVQALNFGINFRLDPSVAVISETWKIIRDFSNMFFIVIMIVMAFAMIFKVPWLEGYDPGHLIVRFIVAALLINFSLVLCGLVISGTQSLNAIFITAIGDFADRMGQFLNPSQWTDNPPNKDLTAAPQLFFSAILLFVVDFAMLVALIFTFIRIPFLWLLMILSPLALLASVLPNTRKAFQNWTEQFIRWNFFLPIFLGVLYVGMILLSQQDRVISSVIVTAGSNPNSALGSLDISIQTLFFYVLVALVFIGGTNAAIKGSLVAGVGAVAGAQWAKNLALRQTGVGAFGKAAQDRWKEIQEKGYGRIPGTDARLFGGPPRGTDLAGRMFGVKGFEQQTLIAKKVNAEKKTLEEEQRSVEELREIMKKDGGYRGLAAGELLLKDKKLSMRDLRDLDTRYNNLKSPIAHKAFRERAGGQLDDMADKNKFRKKEDFEAAFGLIPESERESFLGKATKGGVNPVWIAEKQAGLNEAKKKKAESNPQTEESKEISQDIADGKIKMSPDAILKDILEKMTPKDILKMSPATLKNETKIQDILREQLKSGDVSTLYGAASKKHRDALEQVMSKVMGESVDREAKANRKNLDRIRTTLDSMRKEFTEVAREMAELEQRAQRPPDHPDTITVDQRAQLTVDQQRAKELTARLEQLEADRRKREDKLEKLTFRRERYARGDFSGKAVDAEEDEEEEET